MIGRTRACVGLKRGAEAALITAVPTTLVCLIAETVKYLPIKGLSYSRLGLVTLISAGTTNILVTASGSMLLSRYILQQTRKRKHLEQEAKLLWTKAANNEPVQALLEEGVDPNIVYRDFSVLANAAQLGNLEAVRTLVEGGANVNLRASRNPFPPLHAAVESNSYEVVEYLLSQGADPEIKDNLAQTAEDYARSWGDHVLADLIHNYGKS